MEYCQNWSIPCPWSFDILGTFDQAALLFQGKENENLQIQDEAPTRLTPTMKSTMIEG